MPTNLRLILSAAVVAALLSLSFGAPAAPPEGKGKPDKHQGHGKHERKDKSAGHGDGPLVSVSISSGDARRIATRHNITGYEGLPPGIRKNLARGKPLPPGLAKKAVPPAVLAELPAYDGYEWRVYGSDLVLVSIATAVIADVLLDVFN
ncbi:hypothetical protein C3942_01330 [Solimonas fluminis]|uniref:RcnB family protein n=1 Tax=Solimonas fluminis TaxID=2086571 RepID=A0A2S5TKQ4_9GAMM|nr:anti-virulence regulator CigR family protein [Solimonas fluminis]PPE75564.1 hypothetical protein C3942_01330 [Solimonas fluminis]